MENHTDVNEQKQILNYRLDERKGPDGKTYTVTEGLPASLIFKELQEYTGDWPKLVGEAMYVVKKGVVKQIKNSSGLFAWIAGEDIYVAWKNSCKGAISRDIFYHYVEQNATRFDALEILPHHPIMPRVHYELPSAPEGIYQGILGALLRRFCPASSLDAVYLKALFLTPAWGGSGGSRPAFVLLGSEEENSKDEAGRGVGKTALTDVLAMLYGTCVDFGSDVTRDIITGRLLTSASKRLIRVDNVRGRLASEALESLITAKYISGHQMYIGDQAIPNLFTWIITFNQPDFSKDMAQRAIPVRLKKPPRDPKWWRDMAKFVEENKWKILADIVHILKSNPLCTLESHIRFAEWSDAVLTRCTRDKDVTADIEQRQSETECEDPLIDQVWETIEYEMSRYRFSGGISNNLTFSPIDTCYRIKQSLLSKWIQSRMNYMRTPKLLRLLDRERPDWLIITGPAQRENSKGRVTLGPKVRGMRYIEIGCPRTEKAWVIDVDSRINNTVSTYHRRLSPVE